MDAIANVAGSANNVFVSLDGAMSMEVRHGCDPEAAKRFTTAELRRHFLIETLFRPQAVTLTYSHVDRLVVGGAMPVATPLPLTALKPLGVDSFLHRRELGLMNVGGLGRVVVDGSSFEIGTRDFLYVGMGAREVLFESATVAAPARFYLVSAPAHAAHPTRKLSLADGKTIQLGSVETASVRTLHQVIEPDTCPSCQLVMGFTELEVGSVWNTMPSHVHERRSEVYFYFDLEADARVFHLMGQAGETRHLVVGNEQAVISPPWSLHSGAGTSNYAFVWAMAGENQDFADMDALAMSELR
jgi:4-deoxy-L-threo-5-hexosulose-uronate ketol-isomerase